MEVKTMNEQEEFKNILNYLVEKYHLKIEYPYNDSFFMLYNSVHCLGGMNPGGNNLLANLSMLCEILKEELL